MSANALATGTVASTQERPHASTQSDGQVDAGLHLFSSWNLVDRLPAELLLMIFRLCVTPSWQASSLLPKEFYDWIALTQVSRGWRQFALASPTLWTNMQITKEYPNYATLLLERSGNLPLSVAAYLDLKDTEDAEDMAHGILLLWERIARISGRIRDLEFVVHASDDEEDDTPDLKPLLVHAPRADFGHLQSLRLGASNWESANMCFAELLPTLPSLVPSPQYMPIILALPSGL